MTTTSRPQDRHAADLACLARVADGLGSAETAREARDLAARVTEGRFLLATVGQFKRGKSTLLNALLGERLLPTGVAPITSAVTVVRHGPERGGVVLFKSGRTSPIRVTEITSFVTESENPGNEKAVAAVELFLPSPLLATGMCLVDTPGIGSVVRTNTAETRALVPRIDAALVVLGADPPITSDELAFVSEVAGQVDRLVFVLNKADKQTPVELQEARRFTENVLESYLQPNDRLFEISSTERLNEGPRRDWIALESRLRELASEAGAVVEQAARRGITRLASRLSHDIDEHHDALTRPLGRSAERVNKLEGSVRQGAQLLRDLAALLSSEEHRIIREQFEPARVAFVASNAKSLKAEVRAAVARLAVAHRREGLRQAAYGAAREMVRRRVVSWNADVEPQALLQYRQAAQRFAVLVNDWLTSVRTLDDSSSDESLRPFEPDDTLRVPPRFYFTDLMHLTGAGPFVRFCDQLRSGAGAVRAIASDAGRYAERLLTSNSSRVIFDLRDRLSESRRALESELRCTLQENVASARRALECAIEVRARGEDAIAGELRRLEQYRATLGELTAR